MLAQRKLSQSMVVGGGRPAPQPQLARGRSSVLRRAGTMVGSELPPDSAPAAVNPNTPPGGHGGGAIASQASFGAPAPVVFGGVEHPQASPAEPGDGFPGQVVEPQCGLTPASLKHLRRQRDSLADDKARLQSELLALQAKLREQEERVATMEGTIQEAVLRQTELEEEVQDVRSKEEAQRSRAEELEGLNGKLEDSLALTGAELARMREALEKQRLLTKDVCEVAGRREGGSASRQKLSELDGIAEQLRREREALLREQQVLKEELQMHVAKHEDMQRAVVAAMATAEKAMLLHVGQSKHVEELRNVKLENAINQKVELHISVPRVTLNYNNAPPLLISIAAGLGRGRIKEFLDHKVFPHFEPLWVRMDQLDEAPDGSSKKVYSSRMLDRLTEAVKCFIAKSQQADAPDGSDLSLLAAVDDLPSTTTGKGSAPAGNTKERWHPGSPGTPAGRDSRSSTTRSAGNLADAGIARDSGAGRPATRDRRGAGAGNLAEVDREALLELLRTGDDTGLDAKLIQLMQGGAK